MPSYPSDADLLGNTVETLHDALFQRDTFGQALHLKVMLNLAGDVKPLDARCLRGLVDLVDEFVHALLELVERQEAVDGEGQEELRAAPPVTFIT